MSKRSADSPKGNRKDEKPTSMPLLDAMEKELGNPFPPAKRLPEGQAIAWFPGMSRVLDEDVEGGD